MCLFGAGEAPLVSCLGRLPLCPAVPLRSRCRMLLLVSETVNGGSSALGCFLVWAAPAATAQNGAGGVLRELSPT